MHVQNNLLSNTIRNPWLAHSTSHTQATPSRGGVIRFLLPLLLKPSRQVDSTMDMDQDQSALLRLDALIMSAQVSSQVWWMHSADKTTVRSLAALHKARGWPLVCRVLIRACPCVAHS